MSMYEIFDMMPYERDIFKDLITNDLQKQAE